MWWTYIKHLEEEVAWLRSELVNTQLQLQRITEPKPVVVPPAPKKVKGWGPIQVPPRTHAQVRREFYQKQLTILPPEQRQEVASELPEEQHNV